MTGFRWNALNDAGAHRAKAMDKANKGRGGSTVRVYATTEAMYCERGGDTRTEGSKIADSVRDLWRSMKDEAIWNLRSELLDYSTDETIPF